MSGAAAERAVVLTMRVLALAFGISGVLYIAAPDWFVDRIGDVGDRIGGFADGPPTGHKLWLGLAFAYMAVITAIALVVSTDVARFRPFLLVLALGKAASSLAALGFFLLDRDVFLYLLNFLVDGALVGVAMACWALSGRIGPAGRETSNPAAAET